MKYKRSNLLASKVLLVPLPKDRKDWSDLRKPGSAEARLPHAWQHGLFGHAFLHKNRSEVSFVQKPLKVHFCILFIFLRTAIIVQKAQGGVLDSSQDLWGL